MPTSCFLRLLVLLYFLPALIISHWCLNGKEVFLHRRVPLRAVCETVHCIPTVKHVHCTGTVEFGAWQYMEKGHFLMPNTVIDVLIVILRCTSLVFDWENLLMGPPLSRCWVCLEFVFFILWQVDTFFYVLFFFLYAYGPKAVSRRSISIGYWIYQI